VTTALALAGAFAAAAAAGTHPLPGPNEVRDALEAYSNRNCDNGEGLCNHPVYVEVRALRCADEGVNRARCRLKRRDSQFYIRRPRWQSADILFAYVVAEQRWTVERDFGAEAL